MIVVAAIPDTVTQLLWVALISLMALLIGLVVVLAVRH